MKSWHGVLVATATPYDDRLEIDLERLGEHIAWLAANGCDGATPNGSLGEYQVLTDSERAAVVRAAVEAAPEGFSVIPGVAAYGSRESCAWAEQAAEAGADGVLLLPPNAYRADRRAVLAHYAEVAKVGLPIVAYNNPIDTKVDLTPEIVARLAEIPGIVAVKEFSGDVRRAFEIQERCEILVVAGADDLLFELLVDGAVGWFAGFPNAFPAESVEIYDLARSGRIEEARDLYRQLVPVFRWDSRTEFVQAIKLSMDIIGRNGGPSRPPRGPLSSEQTAQITAETEQAVAALEKHRSTTTV